MIFSTRFECSFSSSPLVSSVNFPSLAGLLTDFRSELTSGQDTEAAMQKMLNETDKAMDDARKGENYTRNEWRRCEITL